MDEDNIKLYTLSTCPTCRRLKKILDDEGIVYREIKTDLLDGQEKSEVLNELKRVNARMTFPTLIKGEDSVCGFDKEAVVKILRIVPEGRKGFFSKWFGR